MKKRGKEEIDRALGVIEQIFKAGSMELPVYHKCLVSLAYEYLLASETQDGLFQLNRVPEAYFREDQYAQMQEDSMYCALVVQLSYRLIQLGLVDGAEPDVVPTMRPALA